MSDTQKYEARLTEMLATITEELKTIGIQNPAAKEDWIAVSGDEDGKEADLIDAADNVEEWNERRAIVATLEPRYNNIVRALEHIEAGTFGICETCNAPIEAARLEANPAARTCVAHMEASQN